MPYPGYSAEDVERRGEQIYEQHIRRNLEPAYKGQFVVIDVETGDYELDDDDLKATTRALAKRSDAVLYGLRVGYPTAYTLGGHIAAEEE